MPPLRTQAKQHDDDVDSYANANLSLPRLVYLLPAVWVNRRTSPPLRRVLQQLRELVPRVHGHGVGIQRPAAQRAFFIHSDGIRRRVVRLERM